MPTEIVNLKVLGAGGNNARVQRSAPPNLRGNNPKIHGFRANISAVKLVNDSNSAPIEITFHAVVNGNVTESSPFGSIPPAQVLQPGQSVEFTVTGGGSLNFTTDPPTPAGNDHSDIHIDC